MGLVQCCSSTVHQTLSYQSNRQINAILSVATGYGQPPATHYDWTLAPHGLKEGSFKLPEEAEARLLIERFCNKVTQILYSNDSDPVGLPSDTERSNMMRFLANDLQELQATLKSHTNPTCKRSGLYFQPLSKHD